MTRDAWIIAYRPVAHRVARRVFFRRGGLRLTTFDLGDAYGTADLTLVLLAQVRHRIHGSPDSYITTAVRCAVNDQLYLERERRPFGDSKRVGRYDPKGPRRCRYLDDVHPIDNTIEVGVLQQQLLEHLPPKHRAAFVLLLRGYVNFDISRCLGVHHSTVTDWRRQGRYLLEGVYGHE